MKKEKFFKKNKDIFDQYKKMADDIYEKHRDDLEKGGNLEHGGVNKELRSADEWLKKNLIKK